MRLRFREKMKTSKFIKNYLVFIYKKNVVFLHNFNLGSNFSNDGGSYYSWCLLNANKHTKVAKENKTEFR